MPDVKSSDRISKKWIRQASVSQQEYVDGVRAPRRSWSDATVQAETSYEQGVQNAISRKAFSKGVTAAGDRKWQQRTTEVGPGRWADGIAKSQSSYIDGFEPYRQTIERTNLPPRGPKGDPKNIERVRVMADALHQEKLKRQGG